MANLPDGSGDAYSNLVQGDGTASLTFVMPGTVPLAVGSVVATVDNGAGADTTATLVIHDPSGEVVATKRQGAAIDAGATGTATWALRLDDEVDPNAAGSLAWLNGFGVTQTTGSTLVPAGQNRVTNFDNGFTNNHPEVFETTIVGGDIIGFKPKLPGLYGVWIASQWDVAAFDKMIGFSSPLVDGLYNGRNSNSEAVYAFFMLSGLSAFTTIACVNKNNAGVDHNVTFSAMSAAYFGAT